MIVGIQLSIWKLFEVQLNKDGVDNLSNTSISEGTHDIFGCSWIESPTIQHKCFLAIFSCLIAKDKKSL